MSDYGYNKPQLQETKFNGLLKFTVTKFHCIDIIKTTIKIKTNLMGQKMKYSTMYVPLSK